MFKFIHNFLRQERKPGYGALELLKYIGPGLLVTVGFIDPGNWASNLAAGAGYGYTLLWMVTLSTVMLIILQHNVAHLGIVTGLCLSEAATLHLPRQASVPVLISAMAASVATSLAEILGGAIALVMLFNMPLKIGAVIMLITVVALIFTNSYKQLEKWIIGFVSIIGLSFVYELSLATIDWGQATVGWVKPSIPEGSMLVIMSLLGAVVMPHNLFLHSEIIQSRQWNHENEAVIKKQLKYEFFDTFFAMLVGWAINSAMILMAAAIFFYHKIPVGELQQAQQMLVPLLGRSASHVFAIALLFAGVASSVTSGMAGGSIFSGFFSEPFDLKDNHSRLGVFISLILATVIVFMISNPFKCLIISQMVLSIQLPFTIFLQIYLTSSGKVMGKYANSKWLNFVLVMLGMVVAYLNFRLLTSVF